MHVRTVAMRAVLGAAAHGGTVHGASGAFRQEFEAAREASPCVLHIRGIASLAGDNPRQTQVDNGAVHQIF